MNTEQPALLYDSQTKIVFESVSTFTSHEEAKGSYKGMKHLVFLDWPATEILVFVKTLNDECSTCEKLSGEV